MSLVLVNYRAEHIILVNSDVGDSLTVKRTVAFLGELALSAGEASGPAEASGPVEEVKWGQREGGDAEGIHISHSKPVRQFCWHCKGDYIAAVTADGRTGVGKGRGYC